MRRTSSASGRILAAVVFVALSSCGTRTLHPVSGNPPIRPSATAAPATATTISSPSPIPPLPTAAQSPTPLPTADIPELQDDIVRKQIDQLAGWFVGHGSNSGLGVAIVERDPQTGQLKAMMLDYGTMGKGEAQQVTPDTLYEIGSITKVFTGILLAEAVEAGTVHLHDPIQDHLPDGVEAPAFNGTPITMLDLATHRSGLPRNLDSDSTAELYSWLSQYHLSREPGTMYAYSNAAFGLLADLLARQAGASFSTLEYQSVSAPLGLMDTVEALDSDQSPRLAKGYTYDGSPAQDFPQSGAMSGAGYLHSTLRDMTRFLVDNMQPGSTSLAGPISMAQTLQAEGRNPGTGVGLGWEIDQVGTTSERLYKGGATYGFTSYLSFQRDGSFGFVLLTNGMFAENLVPHMLKILSDAH